MSTTEMYRQLLTNAVSGSALMGGCCGSALIGGAIKKDGDTLKLPNPNYQPKKIDGQVNPAYNPNANRWLLVVKGSPEYYEYRNNIIAPRLAKAKQARAFNNNIKRDVLDNVLTVYNESRILEEKKPVKNLPKYMACQIRCRESQINRAITSNARRNKLDVKTQLSNDVLRDSYRNYYEEGLPIPGGGRRQKGHKMTVEEKYNRDVRQLNALTKKLGNIAMEEEKKVSYLQPF